MSYDKISPASRAEVVGALADTQQAGGLPSFEAKRVLSLTLTDYALVDGHACGLFLDERDMRHRIVTICPVTGQKYALGALAPSQKARFTKKQGIFLVAPSALSLLPPEAA